MNRHILFIAPSLEAGKSGVGDYVHQLCRQLTLSNIRCSKVAWSDPHINSSVKIKDDQIRFSPQCTPNEKNAVLNEHILKTGVQAISLQYVGHGYHPRGLAYQLQRELCRLKFSGQWHIMLHELWPSVFRHCSLKRRLIGAFQGHSQLKLLHELANAVVQTQTEFYRSFIQQKKVNATLLPICSNIDRTLKPNWSAVQNQLSRDLQAIITDRAKVFIAATYGALYPSWQYSVPLNVLADYFENSDRRLLLIFIGNATDTHGLKYRIAKQYGSRILTHSTGYLEAETLSHILHHVDLGLTTTPFEVLTKSGSALSFMDHECPIYASFHNVIPHSSKYQPHVMEGIYTDPESLRDDLVVGLKPPQRPPQVPEIATNLLEAIASGNNQ